MSNESGVWQLGDLEAARGRAGQLYLEFLRIPALTAGVYTLAAGATDTQLPHHEDEVYYVVKGRARLRAGASDHEVSAGSVIFVAAEVRHQFHDIADELTVLVFFAPAESEP